MKSVHFHCRSPGNPHSYSPLLALILSRPHPLSPSLSLSLSLLFSLSSSLSLSLSCYCLTHRGLCYSQCEHHSAMARGLSGGQHLRSAMSPAGSKCGVRISVCLCVLRLCVWSC